ncbi:MAG: divalent metal cation transporter [Gammaproteobacteria bacterium]|nr:divalent metal cation transporter [Gammaproteobacteria bacterium]MCF6259250.1 divalent metal cation transporter [Gammaproteobacteria bacterium]
MITHLTKILSTLGPGLLYAGAAVGVSHLVMSTKAGASYQYVFLLLIPLIHLIKYPFYKFGPQYTALTGRNILHGYYDLGKWALAIYVIMTVLSMCLIQAAVTIVTSSIAIHFFGLQVPAEYMPHIPAIMILLAAAIILYIGQYSVLDKVMKVVIIILTLTTIIALTTVLLMAPGGIHPDASPIFSFYEYADIIFLAAFLGWMPAPMDVSVWHSVWSEEANRNNGTRASLRKAMLDFRVGFFGTALLAMAFLLLGALVMFGSDEPPSAIGSVFAGQLITMYTDSLGSWAYPLIGIAALATMFSTTLTCLDAYPRTLQESYCIWKNKGDPKPRRSTSKTVYRTILLAAVVGTISVFLIIKNVSGAMGLIVTIATVVSFVSAPVIAYINFRVMHGNTIQEADRPNGLMTLWSRFGITIMTLFSLGYLWLIVTK